MKMSWKLSRPSPAAARASRRCQRCTRRVIRRSAVTQEEAVCIKPPAHSRPVQDSTAFLWPDANVDRDDDFEIDGMSWRRVQTSHFFIGTSEGKSFP
jgi:hypothetical protein